MNRCIDKDISITAACSLVDLNRSLYYYHINKPKNDSDFLLLERIKVLRMKNAFLGAKKLAKLLSISEKVNHKRVARILKDNNLRVARKRSLRHAPKFIERIPVPKDITRNNIVWSIDFMCARKANNFRFMLFNVVDIISRRSLKMIVERSFTSFDVTHELDEAISRFGCPTGIVTDNGAEFTSSHFKVWSKRRGIIHHLTNKGSPAENCFVESFNSCVRREVLDDNNFETMSDLRKKIEEWKNYYNSERPHGSLRYQTPDFYYRLITINEEIAV